MLRILSKNSVEIHSGQSIDFDCCSVGLATSTNIYMISDVAISTIDATVDNSVFSMFKIVDDNIVTSSSLTINDIELEEQEHFFIYKINLLFEPESDLVLTSKLLLTIDNVRIEFYLCGSISTINEKLVVALQNFKTYLSEDYVVAFKESVHNSTTTDTELYNRKMREYLMNINELSTLHGSYNSLFSAIDFFGYGELLELREYWTNGSVYKSTSIANAVLQYIDKSLTGFKKTNQLSLVYQISEKIDYDDDGLPIFKNVFDNADEVLVKMRALKRVLEKDFLAFNTHIVDIIGEFQVMIGADMLLHINSLRSDVVDLNDSVSTKVNFIYSNSDIEIVNHKVIVKPWVFEPANLTEIQIIPNTTTSSNINVFFPIEKIVTDDFEEFEMLTKYFNSDFGLVHVISDFDRERYQRIQITVYEDVVKIFETSDLNFDEVFEDDNLYFGIQKPGTYHVVFSLLDNYGGRTFFSTPEKITISYKEMRIRLGKYANVGDVNVMEAWTSFKKNEGNLVPSAINDTLNINTWDSIHNDPEIIIARKYANDYDMLTNYTEINRLNSISLNRLEGNSLSTWSNSYFVAIIDCFGVSNSGFKYNDIAFEYNFSIPNAATRLQTLLKIIQQCLQTNLRNEFTFDIVAYSNDPTASLDDAKHCIRMRSINSSFKSRFLTMETIDNVGFIEKNHAPTFSNIDAKIQFGVIDPATDNLVIKIGDDAAIFPNMQISTVDDIIDVIENDTQLSKKLYQLKTRYDSEETLTIFSADDIRITHLAIGINYDVARSKHLSSIKTIQSGSDVTIGDHVFACIDNYRKTEMYDIHWKLSEALTSDVLTTQHSVAFRYIFTREGIYNLECKFKHNDDEYVMKINGFVIVV